MTKELLIKKLNSDEELRGFCKKLCGRTDLHNDLYQEFMLVVCEETEDKLMETYVKGLINFYCVRVILNINNKKYRLRRDGVQNTLLNLSSFCDNLYIYENTENENILTPEKLTYNPEATEIYQTAKQLLLSDMASEDKATKRDALRLYETCYLHKNLYQYSLTQQITRQGIMKSVKKATDKLKKRL